MQSYISTEYTLECLIAMQVTCIQSLVKTVNFFENFIFWIHLIRRELWINPIRWSFLIVIVDILFNVLIYWDSVCWYLINTTIPTEIVMIRDYKKCWLYERLWDYTRSNDIILTAFHTDFTRLVVHWVTW